MADTTIILILPPMFFMIALNFVFQASIGSVASGYMAKITCPMPEASGLWNNSGTIMRTNQTYNYKAVNNNVLTLTCSSVHTANGFDYCYGCPTVSFAGMMFYFGDWLSSLAEKIGTIFALLILPFSFPAVIQGLSYFLYITVPLFLMIGVGIYKMVSPFVA